MNKTFLFSVSALFLLNLTACDDKQPNAVSAVPQENAEAATALNGVFAPVMSRMRVLEVGMARGLEAGGSVVVRGRLVGAKELFAEHQAMMQIADPQLVKPNFSKPIPHLACCTPQDVKTANMITVQVIGKDGLPLPVSLKGAQGLKELDYVTIEGVIAPESTAEAPVINAERIQITEPWTQDEK